jgi:catechol 2,3-dioxygenase-like lactoylglutathione lyase family enzyme
MSLRYTSCGLHLKVRDFDASRAFYEGVLGLVPTAAFGDAGDRSRGAIYAPVEGTRIEISEGHPAVPDRQIFDRPIADPKVSAMLHVASFLPLLADKGVRPSYPVCYYDWGTIECVLKDPDGFVIVLIAPYSIDEAARIERHVPIVRVTGQSSDAA